MSDSLVTLAKIIKQIFRKFVKKLLQDSNDMKNHGFIPRRNRRAGKEGEVQNPFNCKNL